VDISKFRKDPRSSAAVRPAREAFTHGLQLAAGISAAVVIVAAMLAVVLLRRVGAGSESAPHPDRTPDAAVATGPCVENS
jgi:DHA2 family multidrug resistance protein-like MFS transporter